MSIKIRPNHFSGTSKVFSREDDGLAAILRGVAIDNASLRIANAITAETLVIADADFVDSSTGVATPSVADVVMPSTAHTASGATGVQIAALNAAVSVGQDAIAVVGGQVKKLRDVLGISTIAFAGTVTTPGTIPAQTKAITAATGTGAASQASVSTVLGKLKANERALLATVNETLGALGLATLDSKLSGDIAASASAPTAAVAAAAGGVGAATKSEVDAFFVASANVIASIAAHWNTEIVKLPVGTRVVAG